jgi:hypothetical protein
MMKTGSCKEINKINIKIKAGADGSMENNLFTFIDPKDREKVFSKIIQDYKKDDLNKCKAASKTLLKQLNVNENMINFHINEYCKKLTSHDNYISEKNELMINGEILFSLAIILAQIFVKINKKYKLKNYQDLILRMHILEVRKSETSNRDCDETIISRGASFSKKNSCPMHHSSSNITLETSFSKLVKLSAISSTNLTSIFKKEKQDISVPDDLLDLMKICANVKTLHFQLFHKATNNNPFGKLNSKFTNSLTLLLINIPLLFSNLLEIKVDFSNPISSPSENQTKDRIEAMTILSDYLPKLIQEKSCISLKLSYLTEPFTEKELESTIGKNKFNTSNFSFLDYFTQSCLPSLISLHLDINILESNLFNKMLILLKINSQTLKELNLNLFPEDIKLNIHNLKKLTKLKPDDSKDLEQLINSIFPLFQCNIDHLLLVLNNLSSLQLFKLQFDLPEIICDNAKYVNLLQKMLFTYLNQTESSNIKTVEISSFNCPIDIRKYTNLCQRLDDLEFYRNNTIVNFSLGVKFYKITKIGSFLPVNLQCLKLGQLDIPSLQNFNIYFCDNVHIFKNLKCLLIDLNSNIFKVDENVISEVFQFFKIFKNSKVGLEEVGFTSKLLLTKKHYEEILKIIDGDMVRSYNICFNVKNFLTEEDYTLPNTKAYYISNINIILQCFPLFIDLIYQKTGKKLKDPKIVRNIISFIKERREKTLKLNLV